ncbi:hypothetical protein [Mycolicibacterium setense]|uniref:hypothetical protein n=1 Tax=Mycolicibacterium setense TaxID=431269 RepID=UPI0021F2AF2C|nr:hypothetical protein [Mycolicibacterium setense]
MGVPDWLGLARSRSFASGNVGVAGIRDGRRCGAVALRGHRRAPEVAIFTGVGSALVFTYAHLLPDFWPRFQDSFLSGPRINVTWFSWVTALSEIGTGLLFAWAGYRAKANTREVAEQDRG